MSLKNKLQSWFYLDEEEIEEQQQQQQDQQRKPEQQQQQRPQRQREEQRFANDEKRKRTAPRQQPIKEEQQPARVVSLQSAKKSSKVILVEPRVYAEAQDISEHLKNKKAVVVNLQRIDREQGIRIVDFLSGTVYAIGGDIQRIGTDIFLCVPENVEVAGAISDYYEQ